LLGIRLGNAFRRNHYAHRGTPGTVRIAEGSVR
jgi:hypothetical protein